MRYVTNYRKPNETILDKSILMKDLGVNLSDDLKWSLQISIMTDKACQIA
jgi:hypothetical protein